MAKKRKSVAQVEKPDALMLIARLLAVHVTKETETNEAALVLSGAGFDDSDVAQMLGITESTVRGIRFRNNKPKRKKSKRG